MSENNFVTISIDGFDHRVPAGTNLIKAARINNKQIPHFCYHDGLSVVGQCRLCLVEIVGQPKLAPACNTIVVEGMKVLTDATSSKVKEAQNSTLEFTLLNHPLDCPICDRGGECPLQNYTYQYGLDHSRMDEAKKNLRKHYPVSKNIILDQERCINCTRCVRFCDEVDGRGELVVVGRGHLNVIDIFQGKPMASPFSGNVVDLCPVGALTAEDYRFKARPWELTKHDAICTGCSVGCNIEIHTKHRHFGIPRPEDNIPTIERLVPRENLNVNEWWMCDKGRWGYHFHNKIRNRISSPLLRHSAGDALQTVHLREIHTALSSLEHCEFWIDDNLPHEGIAWAKSLKNSLEKSGKTVRAFNPHFFGAEFMSYWNTLQKDPWYQNPISWKNVKSIVATKSYRELESLVPILSLKLGQATRRGSINWHISPMSEWETNKSPLETTVYLASPPKNKKDLDRLKKLPSEIKILFLFRNSNARGLLNEGIVPLEILEESLAGTDPSMPIFLFKQTTQNNMHPMTEAYFKRTSLLILADSFHSELSKHARAVIPLSPLYETEATFTSLENFRQFSRGISLIHPNHPELKRGGPMLNPSLHLLV